jgi:hypothetical protein
VLCTLISTDPSHLALTTHSRSSNLDERHTAAQLFRPYWFHNALCDHYSITDGTGTTRNGDLPNHGNRQTSARNF